MKTSSNVPDAIIVGAGIVGAACAETLSREGVRVRLYDASSPGTGATAAGMGHILILDDSEAQFQLTRLSQELWDQRADDLPKGVERDVCGTIWIASDDEELNLAKDKYSWYRERGLTAEILDDTSLYRLEPNLRHGLAGGLLIQGDSVVYPPLAARHFVDQAISFGTEVSWHKPIRSAGEGVVEFEDGTRDFADRVLIAGGIGTCQMIDSPGFEIRSKKGHLSITDRAPGFVRHQLVELGYLKSAHGNATTSVAFNVQPRLTGQVLLGSSRQVGDSSDVVDGRILQRMIQRGCDFLPGLKDLPVIRTWVGFRPSTDDNLPLIGPVSGRDKLWVAAGHEGAGITTSLATADLVKDLWLDRKPAIDPSPYAPNRLSLETHS